MAYNRKTPPMTTHEELRTAFVQDGRKKILKRQQELMSEIDKKEPGKFANPQNSMLDAILEFVFDNCLLR